MNCEEKLNAMNNKLDLIANIMKAFYKALTGKDYE